MKTRTGFSVAVLAAAILLLLSVTPAALSQDQVQGQYQDQGQGNYQDPPTRAGRIGFVQGSVSFQPGGQGDWLEAVPNRPLTTGDNLWVDKNSRAEIQIGATSIRLGPETSVTFLDLGDDVTQLRLSVGSVFFRVRHFSSDDGFEVDAPNLAFNVNQPGEYRLDVNENGDQTVATVWHGEAEVTGGGDSYSLGTGQQGTFSGVDRLNYDVAGIGSPDDFGRWAMSRDEREGQLQSRQYVSDEMTGYEDLDEYGSWHEVSGYGNVWRPAGVPGDWAPYRYGHWIFVAPWGWTWVEQEPWGFAPFHYGRWAFVDSGWCWVPGPVAVRPVYSPALVAFVGGGGFHVGVGVGAGVGWFPLGPGEVFVPWYHTSPRYVQNVNVTNTRVNVVQVTNVYNNVTVNHFTNITYINQRVTNSVTVVNHDTFVNARPVHDNIVRMDAREMASAPVTHEVVNNMRPARQSVLGSGRPVRMRPPDQVVNRAVVGTRQPVSFDRPVGAPGVARTAAPPPPVRMIRSAPATEAQPLHRGQRGSTAGVNPPPASGTRPGEPNNTPDNRGGFPQHGNATPQPGMRGGNPPPGEAVPRPPSAMKPQEQMPPPQGNARPTPPQMRQENPPPQENPRPMPEAPPRQPQMREQATPPPARTDAAPVPKEEPAPQPETRRDTAPRPEARPAEPPRQDQPAHVERRTEKPAPPPKADKPPKEEKEKDKPPKYR